MTKERVKMKSARAGRGDRAENIVDAHYVWRLHIVAVSVVLVTDASSRAKN